MILSNPFEPDPRVYKEAKSLIKGGYGVTILAWDRENKFPANDTVDRIKIIRFQNSGVYGGGLRAINYFLRFYWAVLNFAYREKPWAVHCHDLDTTVVGLALKLLKKTKRFIYDAHEPDYYGHFLLFIKKIIDNFEFFISRKADGVFITNEIQLKKFSKKNVENIIVLRNAPDSNVVHIKSNNKIKGDPILGRIGYIKPQTGIENLLEAASQLKKDFPDIRVLLIGKVFPEYTQQFELLLNEYKDTVTFLGFIPYPKVIAYYSQISIAVILYEGIFEFIDSTPTKLFEAMAFGTPVLISPVGDVKKILSEYPCGIILPDLSTENIQKSIRKLIGDPVLVEKFSENAKSGFRNNYNWQIMEKRLISVYRKMEN